MASPDGVTAVRAPRLPAAERRAQLALVAAARFHQLGYSHVSLADIAEEVGVTGPAVYRHFRSKQALLAGAIASGLDLVEAALERTDGKPLAELVSAVADIGIDRPDLWILLQRESRFLDPAPGAQVREQFRRVAEGMTERLRRERPTLDPENARLLMTAAAAGLASPSVSRTTLPREVYKRELTRAALTVLGLDLPAAPDGGSAAARPKSATPESSDSRRTEAVDKAIDLFFHQGYSAVTLDDIGAAMGMAGPSLYYYFPTKTDILIAAFDRATTRLAADQRRRASSETNPTLDELISSYIAFCLENHALVGIYVSEANNLPPSALTQATDVLREGVREWTSALQRLDGRLYEAVAKVRVNAALAAVHTLARLEELHTRPLLASEIDIIARSILLQS